VKKRFEGGRNVLLGVFSVALLIVRKSNTMEVILNGMDRKTERGSSWYEWIIVQSSSAVDQVHFFHSYSGLRVVDWIGRGWGGVGWGGV
jgi:hypothetical protein